jgi:hypothetical protein
MKTIEEEKTATEKENTGNTNKEHIKYRIKQTNQP